MVCTGNNLGTGQDIEALSFDERLGLMITCEVDERENRRLASRLKKAID